MSSLKSVGIVLKESNFGESDKILTLMLKDIGKMTVYARGARNTKSKFLSGTQLFSYSEFVIFTGIKKKALSNVNLIESFYNIRNDYDKLCYANYFLEMVDKIILENEPSNDVLYLLIKTLSAVSKNTIPINLVAGIFELKFLELIGHAPASDFCSCCNKKYEDFSSKIFFGKDGLLCEQCGVGVEKILISKTALYTINFILKNDIKACFTFEIPEKDVNLINKSTKIFLKNNIDINFVSLNNL